MSGGPDGTYGQPSRESGLPPGQPAGPYWTGAGSNGPGPAAGGHGFGPSASGWYPPATGWDPAAAQRDTGPTPRIDAFGQPVAAPGGGRAGINPAKLLGVVVAVLGALNFVWGFLPELTTSQSDQTLSVFAVGPAYVPVLLLVAGLLALAAFLPGSEVSRLAVAAVSVGGAAGAIVSLGTAGAVELSTTSQINKGMGAILLVIFGIIQAVVAIGAYVVGAGIAVPRAASTGPAPDVFSGQAGSGVAGGYPSRAEPGNGAPGWGRSGPLPAAAAGGWASAPPADPAGSGYPTTAAQAGYRQAAGYPSAGGHTAAGHPPAGGYPASGFPAGAPRSGAGVSGVPEATDPRARQDGSAGWDPRSGGRGPSSAADDWRREPPTGPQAVVGLESRAARSQPVVPQPVVPQPAAPQSAIPQSGAPVAAPPADEVPDPAQPDQVGAGDSPEAGAPADPPPTGTSR